MDAVASHNPMNWVGKRLCPDSQPSTRVVCSPKASLSDATLSPTQDQLAPVERIELPSEVLETAVLPLDDTDKIRREAVTPRRLPPLIPTFSAELTSPTRTGAESFRRSSRLLHHSVYVRERKDDFSSSPAALANSIIILTNCQGACQDIGQDPGNRTLPPTFQK